MRTGSQHDRLYDWLSPLSAGLLLDMNIAGTRFWIDVDSHSVGIRSASKWHQPFECYLKRRPAFLDFDISEGDSESGKREISLCFRLLWFSLHLLLWADDKDMGNTQMEGKERHWGWYFIGQDIHLAWGSPGFHWALPIISSSHVKTEILSLSRNRVVYTAPKGRDFFKDYEKEKAIKAQQSATFKYRYECLNGTSQEVDATVYCERMTWRYKWTPFLRVRDYISVTFSDEVGPEKGSWKGGCTGCGYTMRKGETALACIRRMERDRRFER